MRASALATMLLLIVASCSTRKDPPADATGDLIYELQNCANCHGERGEGRALGPPLQGLAPLWSREELARFLANPKDFDDDPRLADVVGRFPARMARYDSLTQEQREVLADWLLTLGPRQE